jgi:hypothetical protein
MRHYQMCKSAWSELVNLEWNLLLNLQRGPKNKTAAVGCRSRKFFPQTAYSAKKGRSSRKWEVENGKRSKLDRDIPQADWKGPLLASQLGVVILAASKVAVG